MTITIISQTASINTLNDNGPVAIPLTQPACHTLDLDMPLAGIGENSTGVWECSPGRFERVLPGAEVMHIIKGSGSFTPQGGQRQEFRAGDTLFFPANTQGVWEIIETVRKVYVIFA
jgi:hypothetical protein